MLAISRIFVSGFFFALLALGCNNGDKKSDSTPAVSAYGCSTVQNDALVLCTQYAGLSAEALTKIQSNCQLKGNGYTWAAAACTGTNRQTGSCIFAATDAVPAQGTQYFYGSGFSEEDTRQGMCSAQGGTYQ